jgi:S-adenosylmethionine/arginine decarboxylase-like enzyme
VIAHLHRDLRTDLERVGPALHPVLAALGEAAHGTVTFEPHGESLHARAGRCLLLVHTWPEHGRATVDVYGPDAAACRELADAVARALAAG